MKLFRVDGPIYQFFSRLWDMIKLNFLWLLCSLPIVTIGASTVAAYTITLKMVDEQEGYIAKAFFKAFRENLKQGIPLGILAMAAIYIVYLDFQIFFALEDAPAYILVMTIVSIFVFTLGLIYAFPLSARYENTFVNTLKNSWEISLRYFGRTIILVLVIAAEIIFFLFNEFTMLLLVLIGPACIMLTISGMVMYMFRQIEEDPNSVRRE